MMPISNCSTCQQTRACILPAFPVAGTILPVSDDERCSFAKGDTSVWASLKVIHSTLWCFTNVHKEKKGEEIMQSFSAGCYREREGVFITGNMGSLYFSFHQKWSKIGTLVQKDAKEAELKKKLKIFDSAPSY
jgi:hypothetical protein